MQKGAPVFLCIVLLALSSCENPMVNYLLGEKEKGKEVGEGTQSPIARWNDTWYYSLAGAVEAADDGLPASPSLIYVKNIGGPAAMGGGGVTLPMDKHVRIEPYGPFAVIQRWQASGALFTVENGASLTLAPSVTVSGAGITADSPLVKIEAGGGFFMEDGSLLWDGKRNGGGGGAYVGNGGAFTMNGGAEAVDTGIYVEDGGLFTMRGAARAAGTDVYLEDGAKITVDGVLTANPAAVITPEIYDPATLVLDGAAPDIAANNDKFDVTLESNPPYGWNGGPRHWRVDASGHLEYAAARRDTSYGTRYYPDFWSALSAATGSPAALDTITLLSNIHLGAGDRITVGIGHYVRLTVPENSTYTVQRTAATGNVMFYVDSSAHLAFDAPPGSALVIDGGAEWSGGTPAADGAVNTSGIQSSEALVRVNKSLFGPGKFILGEGAVLRNNDRTAGDGGAVEVYGEFVMTGGRITRNRTAENGGGIMFHSDNTPALIAGGAVTENNAALSGGGVMLDPGNTVTVTMTGGSITGNRARGKDGLSVSADFNGYGGGLFIPAGNGLVRSEFYLRGGVIKDNTSDSGQGNGVAMDTRATPAPLFAMSGPAYVDTGNDVHLRNNIPPPSMTPPQLMITVEGPLTAPVPVVAVITMNNYTGMPKQVLAGSPFYPERFAAAGPHYISTDGKMH
jgi:hypothetical protein